MEIKKSLIIILLFIALIPMIFSLAYFITIANQEQYEGELYDNYWNLAPNDEIIWILNDSQYYKSNLIQNGLFSLQAKVVDNADGLLDYDNNSDLVIDCNLLNGLQSMNYPIRLVNPISKFMNAYVPYGFFGGDLFTEMQASNITEFDLDRMYENYTIGLPISTLPFTSLYSSFWQNLEKTVDYRTEYEDYEQWIWNYEIYEDWFNAPYQCNFWGFFANNSEYAPNEILFKNDLDSRPYSQMINFHIDNADLISMDNDSSHLILTHPIGAYEDNDILGLADTFNFYNNELTGREAQLDFNIFPSSDQKFVIAFSRSSLNNLSISDFSRDNQSFFLLFDNNSVYYLEKEYSEVWNGGSWDRIYNLNNGNWTNLNVPVRADQWNLVSLYYTAEQLPEERNFTMWVQCGSAKTTFPMDFVDDFTLNPAHAQFIPQYISFLVIDADSPSESYLDEWGIYGNFGGLGGRGNEFPMTDPTVRDRLYYLRFTDPMSFMIFPNHNTFDYFSLLSKYYDLLDEQDVDLDYLPIYYEDSNYFTITTTEEPVFYYLNAFGHTEESEYTDFDYASYFGHINLNLTIKIDKNTDLLSSMVLRINFLDLNAERVLSIILKSTKTEGRVIMSYTYWDKSIFTIDPEQYTEEKPYKSRLLNDGVADQLSIRDYPINFQLLMNDLYTEVNPLDVLLQMIQSNPVDFALIISSFIIASVFPNYLIWKRLKSKKMQD